MLSRTIGFLSIALLAGCSPDAARQPNSPASPPGPAQSVAQAGRAKATPENTVRTFLSWCTQNHASLPNNFIDHADGQDTTQSYQVNYTATENWLAAVSRSHAVSPKYLQHWRAYFRQWGDTLQRRPQHDGPPAGFDYDFLVLSQEPEEELAELRAGTYAAKHLASGQVLVTVLGPQHDGWRAGREFRLSPALGGQWLIDEMSIPDNLVP